MASFILVEYTKTCPQLALISPLLSKIYLHYTLDLWFEKRIKRQCRSIARIIRYADDYVVCFESATDAKSFMEAMNIRLNKFHLETAPEKTNLLEFGVFAQSRAKARGERAATFDFLGFTHYCSLDRYGRYFRMKRKTMRKRFTAKLRGHYDYIWRFGK
jgi:RNA-directed DNA polymerase